jgi:malonyl CoA-acyl carrier protein transacylase
MYESDNKRVQEIVNLIQMDGCVVEGKKLTLDNLPQLCKNLNDSDKEEISNLVDAIADELSVLGSERQVLDAQIALLRAAMEKLAKLI